MKKLFFQRIFERKSHESLPRARRLLLEALENREMLDANWTGFAAEKTSVYEASADSYAADITGQVDACKLIDLTGDGRNELVAVNYSDKTISVYSNTATSTAFTLKSSQTLDALSGFKGYDAILSVDNSLVVVSSRDGSALTATVYDWNSTTSTLDKSAEYSLNAKPFNSANADICLFVSVSAAFTGSGTNRTLVVQASTISLVGSESVSATRTVSYAGFGKTNFGKTGTVLSAISETLMGSTKINGTDYLILKEATANANNLVLANIGTTISKYTYSFDAYGSALTFDWVDAQDGFIVVGAQTGGKSGVITIKAATPVDGADVTQLGEWIDCDDLRFDASSCGALGDVGGDSNPEIFAVNGSSYLFYVGSSSSAYGHTFTPASLVVSTPNYRSVYVGDVNGDGETEALLVGAERIYTADVDASGNVGEPKSLYKFSQPVKKGVFGDFNGDGLVDVAVLYQANVGSSLQVFQQLSDGTFVALVSQAFNSSLVDIAVGKFSQTTVDEIAALNVRSGSSTSSTVQALKLQTSGAVSLVATRTKTLGSVVGSSLAVGALYGSAYDDVVVVNSTQDSISVVKNGGSSFGDASTITTVYDSGSTAYPTCATIGDFNGDGLADLAVLNSSTGTNYANIVYYLRSEDSGLGSKPAGKVAINSTISISGLAAVDLNSDGTSDLTFVRQHTNGNYYVSALIANGEASVFNSVVNKKASVDPSQAFGATLARVDSGNVSYDFVWAQDKTIGVLLNGDSTSASGAIQYVCQSLSAGSGATLAEATSTARTWIDEWSNFYMDVWANGSGATVASVSAALSYQSSYFKVSDVKAATGYNVSYKDESGTVTVTATGSGTADSNGWVLVARVQFAPVGGVGVQSPSNGVLTALNAGFTASAGSQSLNGSAVETVTAPTSLKLYPCVFDVDENGSLNMNDLAFFVPCLGVNVSNITPASRRVFDYDQNGVVNMNDLAFVVPLLGKSATSGLDSIYPSEPPTGASASLIDDAMTYFVEEDDAADATLFDFDEPTVLDDAFETFDVEF